MGNVQGERSFTTEGKKGKKFTYPIPPAQDWQAKLITDSASVGKKNEPGKFPYVNLRLELLDSATEEGGKNCLLFHMLFTSQKTGKNGDIMTDRADQIVGLAHALGEEYAGSLITMKDENGNDVDCIDPYKMVEWLKAHDGAIIGLHSKVQAANGAYPAKGVVAHFIEVEQDNAFSDGETAEEAEEEIEEQEEEEAPPPPKKAAKPALKVAGKKR